MKSNDASELVLPEGRAVCSVRSVPVRGAESAGAKSILNRQQGLSLPMLMYIIPLSEENPSLHNRISDLGSCFSTSPEIWCI